MCEFGKVENICPYCEEHFFMNKKSFANHVRWCKKNPNYENIKKSTLEKIKKYNDKKYGLVTEFEVECANPKCKKHFHIKCKENLFKKDKKYFCCISCANTHKLNEETKKKISEGVIKYLTNNKKQVNGYDKICKMCENTFHTKKKKQVFCSIECSRKYRRIQEIKQKNEKEIYKSQTKFKFNLNSYPEEFNFSLIKENGWYKASNHGNNLKGISRDHMFSVDEGYKNNVDPYLISHPANCKLMKHEDNFKKKTNCSITLKELKDRILYWNNKYGYYPNMIDYTNLNRFNSSQ